MWKAVTFVFHPRIRVMLVFSAILVLLGAYVFHMVEGWRFIDSLYFTMATVTTVGYGDFTPTHDVSKILAIFYMLLTIPVVLVLFSLIGELIHDQMLASKKRR